MNKSAWGMMVMGLGLLMGCASGVTEQRGSMVMAPDSVKAFAAGPAIVRAYSLDDGGRVFVASAKTGTDADCAGGLARGSALEVDRRNVVTLGSGQVACVAASTRRGYELMWHARPAQAAGATILVAQAQR